MIFKRKLLPIIFLTTIILACKAKQESTREFLGLLSQKTGISENQSFFVEKITYNADIPFSKHEFTYLTNLKKNKYITLQEIAYAYKQLKKKKRFFLINTSITQGEKGKKIHFSLTAHWIFKQIEIRGILFGKNRYEDLYLQNPGDIFDVSLHEESMDAIKNILYKHGYFNCSVTDEIIYNKKNKTITVKLFIKKGHLFKINKVNFSIHQKANQKIIHKLTKKISPLLYDNTYTRKLLDIAKNRIKKNLIKYGFTKNQIALKYHLNYKTKKINLLFILKLSIRQKITLSGNHFFSNTTLQKDLITQDKPVWLLDPSIIKEQILHKYHTYGFWFTKIYFQKKSSTHYHFLIEENKRICVDTIVLKDIATNKEEINKFFFIPFLKHKFYDEEKLKSCIEKLKSFYLKHGFWDFAIVKQEIFKNKNDNYTIRISIKKGSQRFLHNISIEPFKELEKADFFKKQISYYGQPCNPEYLSKQRLFLLNHFQKQGYWYIDAYPTFAITPQRENSKNVSITWHIQTGNKVVFDKVFIKGTTKLPFNRIIEELQFKEGELWNRKKLDASRRKLKKLGIFKHVEIQPQKLSRHLNKKPISLILLDDDPFEIKLRTGYFLTSKNFLLKRESTYKLGASFLIKNPLNLADKLFCNTNFTKFEKNIDFNYRVPHIFKNSLTGNIKAYYHKYTHPLEVGKSDSAYEAIQNGFLVGLIKEHKSTSFFGINIGNEWMATSRARGNLNLAPHMINKTIPYFFLEPNLIIDNRDNKLHTTKGSLSFASLKIMIPEINRSSTCKFMIDHSLFLPFSKKVICAMRIRWGQLFQEKFNEVMPIERFYLGGANSIRGYSKDAVPPLGLTIKQNPNGETTKEYTIQGGSSMINGNLELRFPIYKALGAVIFQDIGTLSQSGFSGFTKRWYPTSGWGLRYQTPIGSLRFDIGWKWKKTIETEPSYSWYLTLGQIF